MVNYDHDHIEVNVDDKSLIKIGTCYTREAGVKNLEKELANICHLLRQFTIE